MTVDPRDYLAGLFGAAGKTVVVTGAAEGLGREMATGFARCGANVVLVDRNAELLHHSAAELAHVDLDASVVAVPADVTSEAEVDALFDRCAAQFSGVDVLVNNAGALISSGPPETYSLQDWQDTLAVNLTATFLCARRAGRDMIAAGGGGAIVNLSSIGGVTSLAGGALAYDVSKSAVIQLTKELAVEWAQYGIRVNALAPCHFRTRGWQQALQQPGGREAVARIVGGIPLGRMGEAHEIVGAALFLASDAAALITGVVLPVDGGNLALNATHGGVLSPARHAAVRS